MDCTFGNASVFYGIDPKEFKKDFGITGYLGSNLTFNQIAEKYNIDKAELKEYMQPYYLLNGWKMIFQGDKFWGALWRTVLITTLSIIFGGLLGIATGSVLAGFRKKIHLWIYSLYMLQMVIPPVMVMIPQFMIVQRLGLYNTIWGIVLFNIKGGALSTMIFTSYIAAIPRELKESVLIDGGGHYAYFIHILLPLCKIPFASFAVIQLPLFWNDLLYPMLFLKPNNYTLVPWINSFVGGEFATNFQAIYTGLFISILPLLVIYMLFQKYFVKAALSGAIKG
jgi:multiple sugar transport system permease protein